MKIAIIIIPFFIGCSLSEDSQDKIGNSPKSVVSEYKDATKDLPTTDKSSQNDEWNRNVYRNNKYKFRVELPNKWEYDNGTSANTLVRAINREIGAVIAISVTHLLDPGNTINDIREFKSEDKFESYFRELMLSQKVVINEFRIKSGSLNNFPAYLIEATNLESAGDKSYDFISKQTMACRESKIYNVVLNIPLVLFDSNLQQEYNRVVESFKFEIL